MSKPTQLRAPIPIKMAGEKQTGSAKISANPVTFDAAQTRLKKPDWIRVRLPRTNAVHNLKKELRKRSLVTVCEEASCPNIHECFSKGTATFMILGDICTRRCAFCDVAHGRPKAPNPAEPKQLADTIIDMKLRYVVITSVDRDDLRDGGAAHFRDCIQEIRERSKQVKIEILTPDFRGKNRFQKALDLLSEMPPDVFNHNLETVEPLYQQVRPGANYQWSLNLLKEFKLQNPNVASKSGIMLGLGEDYHQIVQCMEHLREHNVDMITIGQYLQPSIHHHPVLKYWTPNEFDDFATIGYEMGFTHVASGPMVRSSYHADLMALNSGLVTLS